jgi:two-component system chemotaxis response regulator CheB
MIEPNVVIRRQGPEATEARPVPPRAARPRIVVLAASTGGPVALARILSELPGDFSLPLVAVQHIASGFVENLVAWLDGVSPLHVKIAAHAETLNKGVLYIAPDDHHLGFRSVHQLALSSAPSIHGFRPSASFLFKSAAEVFGASTVALILTGMGQDGVDGLRAVHSAGGHVIAQDQASSVVHGMPSAALAAGVAHVTLPIGDMASRLKRLAS